MRRSPAGGGAVSRIEADFALFAVGVTPTPEISAAVTAAVDDVLAAMQPWAAGIEYLNFAERRRPGDSFFGTSTHDRLRQVKAAYDSLNLIRANHQITPAKAG